jgi:hypothetical protein
MTHIQELKSNRSVKKSDRDSHRNMNINKRKTVDARLSYKINENMQNEYSPFYNTIMDRKS